LTLVPGAFLGEISAIYLDDVTDTTIIDNRITGLASDDANLRGRGIVNTFGGAGGTTEQALIQANSFSDLTSGVSANPTAIFTVNAGNVFSRNVAGTGLDAATSVTENIFTGNEQGVGLGTVGSLIEGNVFADDNVDFVCDFTNPPANSLVTIQNTNVFPGGSRIESGPPRCITRPGVN